MFSSFNRMSAKMLHPSSGYTNFNVVYEKTNDTDNQDQNSSQSQYKTEIEIKTKDAITDAIKSHPPILTNDPTSNKGS
jgi:hypothetical protein